MGRPAKTLTPETESVGSNPTLSANSLARSQKFVSSLCADVSGMGFYC